ncbi:hypothetical protein BJV82DRAFT_610281 [Fennellomyces sp. T-0311]|nr:hypothetical protein BJV82DRAFT_610281 [Fennellomyces sp. T-0311]
MDRSFDIAVTTIPRLLLYVAFLYKTKDIVPYYYIWIPALVSFVHNGLFFVTPSLAHDTALHCSLVATIWLAIAKYWDKLDKRNIRYRDALIYYFIVVPVVLLAYTLFIWYINKKSTPGQWKMFSTSLSALLSSYGFIAIMLNRPESSSASSSISLYAFTCIMTLQPAESVVEAAVAVYGDKWIYAEKVLPIGHIAAFLIETGPYALLINALHYKNGYTWPPFKTRTDDPELVPGFRYGSIQD